MLLQGPSPLWRLLWASSTAHTAEGTCTLSAITPPSHSSNLCVCGSNSQQLECISDDEVPERNCPEDGFDVLMQYAKH